MRSILPGLKEETKCGRENCVVHTSGGKGNCNKQGAVYQGICVCCEQNNVRSVYFGETGKSTFVRGKQHLTAIGDPVGKQRGNAFAKHIMEKHNGNRNIKFRFNVVKTFKKPMERQIREGVEIARAEVDMLLNSKLDHYQPQMRRVRFTQFFDELEDA